MNMVDVNLLLPLMPPLNAHSELELSVYGNHQHAACMHGQYRSIHMNMQLEVVRF